MLHFPRWQDRHHPCSSCSAASSPSLPNFFSKETGRRTGRTGCRSKQMVLGLDLQGGAYLLYEVDQQDYVQKRLQTLVSDVRKTLLQEPRIGYTGLAVQGDAVQLRIRDLDKLADARKRLEPLRNPLVASLLGGGTRLRVRPDRRRRRARPFHLLATPAEAAAARHRRRSRSRSSTAASTSSARPSRASSGRATTASWSRRPASATRRA